MATYRIYYGDHSGKVFSADDLEAPNDEAAIGNAVTNGKSPAVEVWQHERLVLKHPAGLTLTGGKPPHLAMSLGQTSGQGK
jgi:hypothetical protein